MAGSFAGFNPSKLRHRWDSHDNTLMIIFGRDWNIFAGFPPAEL
jgi:hypothetical protein